MQKFEISDTTEKLFKKVSDDLRYIIETSGLEKIDLRAETRGREVIVEINLVRSETCFLAISAPLALV